jgi:hypothetical protein
MLGANDGKGRNAKHLMNPTTLGEEDNIWRIKVIWRIFDGFFPFIHFRLSIFHGGNGNLFKTFHTFAHIGK